MTTTIDESILNRIFDGGRDNTTEAGFVYRKDSWYHGITGRTAGVHDTLFVAGNTTLAINGEEQSWPRNFGPLAK
jgi:hypothetical protein